MKLKILNFLSKYFGIKITKVSSFSEKKFLLYEDDSLFISRYQEGMLRSGTPDAGAKRLERFYNLIQFLKFTSNIDGAVVECGAWRGLSSYLMCLYIKDSAPEFSGHNFLIIDSFEGLSEPNDVDVDPRSVQPHWPKQPRAGAYAAQQEVVRNTLVDFPNVQLAKGWIPEVFATCARGKYRFVHIDLDLYEPILSSLEFFWPQIEPGGVLIVDDYGSLHWPGAKAAVEEFSIKNNLHFVGLSTGQAIFIK